MHLLNVVKCDLKKKRSFLKCPGEYYVCAFSCGVSSQRVQCLMKEKRKKTVYFLLKCLNMWMQWSYKRMCGFFFVLVFLFYCGEALREIHSFIWVSDVRVKGKHLARLFNSACWWAVNQAWAFDNMPDCTASHASVCPHKAAHDVTQNWSILINHWPFRGCTGTIVNWLSK